MIFCRATEAVYQKLHKEKTAISCSVRLNTLGKEGKFNAVKSPIYSDNQDKVKDFICLKLASEIIKLPKQSPDILETLTALNEERGGALKLKKSGLKFFCLEDDNMRDKKGAPCFSLDHRDWDYEYILSKNFVGKRLPGENITICNEKESAEVLEKFKTVLELLQPNKTSTSANAAKLEDVQLFQPSEDYQERPAPTKQGIERGVAMAEKAPATTLVTTSRSSVLNAPSQTCTIS